MLEVSQEVLCEAITYALSTFGQQFGVTPGHGGYRGYRICALPEMVFLDWV